MIGTITGGTNHATIRSCVVITITSIRALIAALLLLSSSLVGGEVKIGLDARRVHLVDGCDPADGYCDPVLPAALALRTGEMRRRGTGDDGCGYAE